MIVLSNKCKKCNGICNAIRFQRNFQYWTSGNDNINKFIQDTQLSAHNNCRVSGVLEWIPYNKFHDIRHTIKSGIYRATWIDGYIFKWDYENHNWKRKGRGFVVLKRLKNI